ncbi:hypothetical protein BV378_02525 [Nostoc sp. RF31YmG]|nr:hypothetical protein BV378_02525 [Nostoc sp. RF31YmG]
MNKIRPEVVNRRIESFAKRFGKAHLYLAYHAAFPLALTPDLLYRLWANFQRDINGEVLNIPWIAVADLLLSNLCDEVGNEIYEMNLAVRNLLLKRLQEDKNFGQQRINELSDFLLEYVRQKIQSDDPDIQDFAHTQRWVALAYTRPTQVAHELALAFSKLDHKNKAELLRMSSLTETFAEPLTKFQPLLIYARGMRKLAQGDIEAATSVMGELIKGRKQIEVAGVRLPIPEKLKVSFQENKKPETIFKKLKKYYLQLKLSILFIFIGGGLITWQILNTNQVSIKNFSADSFLLTESEDEVVLSWEIYNYRQLVNLILTVKGPQPIQPTIYDFRNGIPEVLSKPCFTQRQTELICKNIKTGISTKGNYTFELQGLYRKSTGFFAETAKTDTQTTQVVINDKPIAEIIDFRINKPQYKIGENILVNWTIANPLLLKETQITTIADEGTTGNPIIFKFAQGNINNSGLKDACKEANRQLQCTNIPIPPLKAGKYAFELKALANNGSEKISAKKIDGVEVLANPINILYFTINGNEQPSQSLKEGETATLTWRVEGEDIQVKLLPYGNDLKPIGSLKLPVISEFPSQIALQVIDKSGKQPPQQRGFAIAVIKKVVPTPTPLVINQTP